VSFLFLSLSFFVVLFPSRSPLSLSFPSLSLSLSLLFLQLHLQKQNNKILTLDGDESTKMTSGLTPCKADLTDPTNSAE
jgi:hypothetical protein